MALDRGAKGNFETLQDAAKRGRLALVECADVGTGEVVSVVCAVVNESDGIYEMVPVARLFNGNPYDEILSPLQIDEFKAQFEHGTKDAQTWLKQQEWVG
jgi:hypothetical protein